MHSRANKADDDDDDKELSISSESDKEKEKMSNTGNRKNSTEKKDRFYLKRTKSIFVWGKEKMISIIIVELFDYLFFICS